MKKMMFLLAIVVIVMTGCSKDEDPYNPPTPPQKDSVVFTLSRSFSPLAILNDPNNIVVEENSIYLIVKTPQGGKTIKFNPNGETKVFKGLEAEQFIGSEMEIYPVELIYRISPYKTGRWTGTCIPEKVTGVIEKNKHYTFSFAVAMNVQ